MNYSLFTKSSVLDHLQLTAKRSKFIFLGVEFFCKTWKGKATETLIMVLDSKKVLTRELVINLMNNVMYFKLLCFFVYTLSRVSSSSSPTMGINSPYNSRIHNFTLHSVWMITLKNKEGSSYKSIMKSTSYHQSLFARIHSLPLTSQVLISAIKFFYD